jgi:hypothetical protein
VVLAAGQISEGGVEAAAVWRHPRRDGAHMPLPSQCVLSKC